MAQPPAVHYIEKPMAQTDVIPIFALAHHFPVRVRHALRLSDDELFEFSARNGDLQIERTSEGEVIVMSPTGGASGRRNFLLIVHLGAWAARDGTGVGFDSSTGFLLPNGAERAPDASWLRRERWDALTPEQRRKFVPLCPDFVVELRSQSDDLTELQAKMGEYIACGVRLGWLIDVEAKRAWVYRPGRPVESVDNARTLSAAPELPGLVLGVGEVRLSHDVTRGCRSRYLLDCCVLGTLTHDLLRFILQTAVYQAKPCPEPLSRSPRSSARLQPWRLVSAAASRRGVSADSRPVRTRPTSPSRRRSSCGG